MRINNYPLKEDRDFIVIDGKVYFSVRVFSFYKRNLNKVSASSVRKKVSKNNYIVVDSQKGGIKYLFSAMAVYEWINMSLFTSSEKNTYIKELKDLGLIDCSLSAECTRTELMFLGDLQDFIAIYDPELKVSTQVNISDGIVVDAVIGDKIIIEYDENNHLYYNKEQEAMRDFTLKRLGYNIIRISDKESNIKNIALICKKIFIWTRKL